MVTKMKYIIFVLLFASDARSDDEYVEEALDNCNRDTGLVSCGKYKILKYLSSFVQPVNDTETLKSVRFINLKSPNDTMEVYSTSRSRNDSEFGKFSTFLRRKIGNFLKFQGFALQLPDSIQVLVGGNEVEGRGKKKKIELLLSILTLFKVFKVKVLLAVALAVLIFIKKTILLGALYFPSILHSIKASCKSHAYIHEDHHDVHEGYGKDYENYYYKS